MYMGSRRAVLITPPTGPVLDSATKAWVNAVVSVGGTVSATQKGYVDTLIRGLKTDGLFSLLDRMWLLASENTHQAQIDIVNLGTWTSNGTITFSANHGYTGDGSSGYLDTNFNASTAGGNYALNSAHFGVYSQTSRTTSANYSFFGASNGSTCVEGVSPLVSGTTFLNVNDLLAHATSLAANTDGQWLCSRTGSTTFSVFHKNGTDNVNTDTETANSVSVLNGNFFISARNLIGTGAQLFSADQLSCVYFGGGLNGTQLTNMQTRVNTYHTSLGINLY